MRKKSQKAQSPLETDSQRIGRFGESLFPTLIPEEWHAQERDGNLDFGVDFDVEVWENGRRTGLRLRVQVKSETGRLGARTITRNEIQTIRHPLKRP